MMKKKALPKEDNASHSYCFPLEKSLTIFSLLSHILSVKKIHKIIS